ncbi:Protein sof1 [Neolecta irregularis DAH-3]|uniref:Protein sof1 n=1 Tax=Neolecta irregularis (strain DAH-3) TaxID=1198029 RepID=A0A1U7LQ30_NEOID|nr:Protein sof1 [Neolecta irregularis DAH-3]|eukprot:OLL24693.1 Protein sof1 [Neolecta irregularis DAH-3]
MKIKALSRSHEAYLPRKGDHAPLSRNIDPALHPFEKAREYTRALNATKLDRLFAKPFVGQLGRAHVDGVYCMAKNKKTVGWCASGSADGYVKTWDLASREEIMNVQAHDGIVKALGCTITGDLLSCSTDKTVKLWSQTSDTPKQVYHHDQSLSYLSPHAKNNQFATVSSNLDIWDISRSSPIETLEWATESLLHCSFNSLEPSLIAATGSSRSLIFYDLRTSSPLEKLTTSLISNAVSWNPLEAFTIAAANEDGNIYIFDMRHLKTARNVLKDHVAPVTTVDYSPTGQDIVSGSYDKTVRLFNIREGRSRDIYHTKRMQRVFSVLYSMDNSYVLSGSDDGNIRVWRSQASKRTKILSLRERSKLEYDDSLKERFKHMPEIKRIARHRHVPHMIKSIAKNRKEEEDALKRKRENRRRHEKGIEMPKEREKMVVGVAK